MRNRFFIIILSTLIFSAIAINFVHVYFFKHQRIKLIDQQITESSNALLVSDEFLESVKNPNMVEETISDILAGARIGKVFILRDRSGKILYQSFNANLLTAELPTFPEWVVTETKNEYIRLRNINLKKHNIVLQVGLVVDRNFLEWEILDNRVISYVVGIIFSLFVASAILTLILLSPLRLLIEHLNEATANLVNLKKVSSLPSQLTKYSKQFWSKSDEFSSLVVTIQKLIDRINLNYKLTKSWNFQMAHELKTPLAIMRAETVSRQKENTIPDPYAKDILYEIQNMSEIINQFLDWAELENSSLQQDIHAVRMKSTITTITNRINKISPRIKLSTHSDFSVLANPNHVDQFIANLVTNALKFSPQHTQVEITLADYRMTVRDHGFGIPESVKERIGQPFNTGPDTSQSGNGLGLAWISTIAKKYDWDLKINSNESGTEATVHFPTLK